MRRLAAILPTLVLSWGVAKADTLSQARAKLHHLIFIMQENRSFDHYFGTFPGADGFPRDANGNIAVCVPLDPADPQQGCIRPFHDTSLINAGAAHQYSDSMLDVDGGKMDGFIFAQTGGLTGCHKPKPGFCPGIKIHDVMGYHTAAEIPHYWAYAQNFVLQDRLFEPTPSWSFPAHLYIVSEWAANCTSAIEPSSCDSDAKMLFAKFGHPRAWNLTMPWTNITWLLDHAKVSWRYYLAPGQQPNCADDDEFSCTTPDPQKPGVPGAWNPLPFFSTFKESEADHPGYAAAHIPTINRFWEDVRNGELPTIVWLGPSGYISEHPNHSVRKGMLHVTKLVNEIARSQYWNDTAIFIAWDDWGGFYDHVVPPVSDHGNFQTLGYGIRVPGLIVSPWVKAGRIDHQTMSFDAYTRLIEDLFLNSQRLDPATDGRPDPRPDVREALTVVYEAKTGKPIPVGDLLNDFDFTQKPLAPLLLPEQ